jgi:transcriptional regulator with XRE-family HTH domain
MHTRRQGSKLFRIGVDGPVGFADTVPQVLAYPGTGGDTLDTPVLITHDNVMSEGGAVSEHLRRRRLELGLTLSEVAQRAGTSPATLCRYERGWTRFETYTLRKLASALGCELRIELRPKAARRGPSGHPSRAEARARLKRLFWDHPLTEADFEAHPVWLAERVLEYGNLDDIHLLRDVMGNAAFLQTVARAGRVSPRTRSFWSRVLELEGIACTRAYSRGTAWSS